MDRSHPLYLPGFSRPRPEVCTVGVLYLRCVWHHIRLGLDLSKLRTHTYNTDPFSLLFLSASSFPPLPPPPSPASRLPLPCSHRVIHALPQASTTLTHALIKGYLGSADPSSRQRVSCRYAFLGPSPLRLDYPVGWKRLNFCKIPYHPLICNRPHPLDSIIGTTSALPKPSHLLEFTASGFTATVTQTRLN